MQKKQHSSCKRRMVLKYIVYRCEKLLKSRYIYRKSNKYSEENNLKNGEQLLFERRGSFQEDSRFRITELLGWYKSHKIVSRSTWMSSWDSHEWVYIDKNKSKGMIILDYYGKWLWMIYPMVSYMPRTWRSNQTTSPRAQCDEFSLPI